MSSTAIDYHLIISHLAICRVQLSEIDENQKAINKLKANLVDDLNDRGVLSDYEAEQCLEQHRAQQEKLARKLNQEKEKQEKVSIQYSLICCLRLIN